jgi:TetR/AcrR family transcriptional regulator, regulator of cefoperazone and chloramphenicol sensitivity
VGTGEAERSDAAESAPRPARAPETLARHVEPVRDRNERATRRGDDTRARVIGEAATCVIDEGFANASANRIAQRAGVTWGVIQYHFGDRAGLFSAVVLAGYGQFRACLEEATIPEQPVRARVAAVVDAAWRAYRSPLGRASLEILINTRASRNDDPEHAAQLIEMARGVHRIGDRLLADSGRGQRSARSVEALLWAALRGFAMTLMFTSDDYDFTSEREALVNVLTAFPCVEPGRPEHIAPGQGENGGESACTPDSGRALRCRGPSSSEPRTPLR